MDEFFTMAGIHPGIAKLFGLIMDRDAMECVLSRFVARQRVIPEKIVIDDYDHENYTGASANINDVFVPNALGTPRAIDVDLNCLAGLHLRGTHQRNLIASTLSCRLDESDLPDTDPNWYEGGR